MHKNENKCENKNQFFYLANGFPNILQYEQIAVIPAQQQKWQSCHSSA